MMHHFHYFPTRGHEGHVMYACAKPVRGKEKPDFIQADIAESVTTLPLSHEASQLVGRNLS